MKRDRHAFDSRQKIRTSAGPAFIYRLASLEEQGISFIARLPFSIKILLEAALRQMDGCHITEKDVLNLANWRPSSKSVEIPFKPSRVILQDASGVPALVDLATLRDVLAKKGVDPSNVNPLIPVDLIIDHSVEVDHFGTRDAVDKNVAIEFRRNKERYEFLKWAQQAFKNFRVVPPTNGIIHQVNLEYLAQVVHAKEENGRVVLFPDSVIGTDSHTTMINSLGVLGWGVGGIEAETAMLGQVLHMLMPEVIGVKLVGALAEGVTATDLALTLTQVLRQKNVVGKFVEFYGPGLSHLSLPDRATVANMAPEYGATMGFFPVDQETLLYLRTSGRSPELVERVEVYTKEQGLFYADTMPELIYSENLEFDLSTVEAVVAGPKRPQDKVLLSEVKRSFHVSLTRPTNENGFALEKEAIKTRCTVRIKNETVTLTHGSIVIAAITSCTNTSNPMNMIGAGLLAKKAVDRGLKVPAYIKTSLAPGSKIVSRYLEQAGLTPYLEALNFYTVGYGCTTCVGNSGSLYKEIEEAIREHQLVVASVLSGNRNFEGRIHPYVKANFLASPPLVIAYALAGTVNIDMRREPLGRDRAGNPVYLRDIWPGRNEIQALFDRYVKRDLYQEAYDSVFTGNELWKSLNVKGGDLYQWDERSTYFKPSPFFAGAEPGQTVRSIRNARALLVLGDSVTTDHISPVGYIPQTSAAGQYLMQQGIEPEHFNSYGARRGNHEVLVRGTFANIRLRNMLVNKEGGYTRHLPTGKEMSIYEAAVAYQKENIPLIVLAGKEYGTGSARDWAAKGTYLLGIKAVIAESFERIHRNNLVFMGVLPLQFMEGQGWRQLGLSGEERFTILGLEQGLTPRQRLDVVAERPNGDKITFSVLLRLDTTAEVDYYSRGGILKSVLLSYHQ
ncbi:MAG: aconitate hydratase 1 [Bacillus thermozeamaize]|uniref:Aconitate hydratase n=1 Tax=Bacillus thermozeamaize TaxID=230954 RepID=A0A1Y3PW62_9BACI|nr:MAG: aconitate hydratase 1 [Bacillus thermozeamaize]